MKIDLKATKVFDDINEAYSRLMVNSVGEMVKRYRLIVSYGSSRSSKTYSIMQLFAIILVKRKNFKITVWRGTRVDAVATVMEDFKAVLLQTPFFGNDFVLNKKDATFTSKSSGSVIHFMGTDDTQKVLGMRQDISFFNEISHFSREVYLQVAQRTSETMFSDYNPSGVTILDGFAERDDTIFLRSTFMDNPFLTDGIRNQLLGYNPFAVGSTYVSGEPPFRLMNSANDKEVSDTNVPPPNELNIKNKTADLWMWMVYGLGLSAEKPNRIYKGWSECTDKFYDELDLDIYCGLDFGISSPTAVVEVKFDGDRTFYVKQKLYLPMSKMGIPLYEYLLLQGIVGADVLTVCDSAKTSMVDDLALGGLMAVGAKKGQGSVARNIAQVQSFNIVYTESSLELKSEYGLYSWKLDRYDIPEDAPEPKAQDHLMNSLEYVVSYLVDYLSITYG